MELSRYLLIYNPKAGKSSKRPTFEHVVQTLESKIGHVDAHQTAYAGHARELAQKAADCKAVICCGGDGTLNEVVCGLRDSGIHPKVAYLPMGSTNDFAGNTNLPKDIAETAELIANDISVGYDIGMFGDRMFTYIAAFGPGTVISYSTPQKMKNVMGYSAYIINGFVLHMISTLREIKPKHIIIEHDGEILEDDFYFGSISNTLTASGMFKFDENEVRFNDGKFEVMLIRRIKSPLQAFPLFAKMLRHDYDGETLLHFQASHMKLTFDNPEPWTLDGEFGGKTGEIEIDVAKSGIELYTRGNEFFI